jgi:hypothetical protein
MKDRLRDCRTVSKVTLAACRNETSVVNINDPMCSLSQTSGPSLIKQMSTKLMQRFS